MISTLISFVLLYPAIPAQAWTTPVAFHLQAEPLSVAVERLSKITGEPLKVQPALADDLIIVHTDSSTPQEIIDNIAWAEYGKWEEIDQVKTLVSDRPNPAKAKRNRDDWILSRLKAEFNKNVYWADQDYRSKLESARDRLKSAGTDKSDDRKKEILDEVYDNHPDRRLFVRLGRAIGLDQIAAIPDFEERVYANFPGPYLLALPTQFQTIVNAYAQECQAFNELSSNFAGHRSAQANNHPTPVDPRSNFLLRIEGDRRLGVTFLLSEYGVDQIGKDHSVSSPIFPLLEYFPRVVPPPDFTGKFTPSKEALERLHDLTFPGITLAQRQRLAQKMIEDAKNRAPDLPFTLTSDYLHHVSHDYHRLVVALPEDVYNVATDPKTGLDDKVAAWVMVPGDYETQQSADSWVLRPRTLAFGELYQLPRPALMKVANEFLRKPSIDILQVADATRQFDLNTLGMIIWRAFDLTGFDRYTGLGTSPTALKAVTLLPENDKQALRKAGEVKFKWSELSSPLRSFIVDQLTHHRQVVNLPDKSPLLFNQLTLTTNALLENQSEVLAGITPTSDVSVTFKLQTVTTIGIDVLPSDQPRYYAQDLQSVVRTFYPYLDPDKPMNAENQTAVIYPVSTLQVQITLKGGRSVTWCTYLPVTLEPPKAFSLDSPPPELRKEMERMKKAGG